MNLPYKKIKKLMLRFSYTASKYTDVLLVLNITGKLCGFGSCIHIRTCGRILTVSCNHVAYPSSVYFSGPERLKKDIITDEDISRICKIKLIKRYDKYDLAVFDSSNLKLEDNGKFRYDLDKSRKITFEVAKKNVDSICFIYGILGSKTRVYNYPDGMNYMQLPIYTGIGPLVSVANDKVIADFAEKEMYELNVEHFPQLEGLYPTGGSRDISGASGSGLWIQFGDEILLIGILLGPKEASSGKHLIRFTPIWIIQDLVRELF